METNYSLPIFETISTAWQKISGSKTTFFTCLAIFFGIQLCLGIILYFVEDQMILSVIFSVISFFVSCLLTAGIFYLGLRRAFDLPISYEMMFKAFEPDMILKIIGAFILQMIIFIAAPLVVMIIFSMVARLESTGNDVLRLIIACGYLISFIIAFYLAIRMSLNILFVLDKHVSPLESIKLSFQATQSNVWRLIGLFITLNIINFIAMIPLGIGLIWTMPLAYIVYGIVYKKLLANVASSL